MTQRIPIQHPQPLNPADMNSGSGTDAAQPPTVDFESLKRYSSAKLTIANQLRTLLDFLKKRGDEARVQRCEQLMAKLAEDRFTIAVLGQFKRGKSSLLNAIIGHDLLPTGILPLTSVITVVRFGARQRLVIYRKGLQFPVCDSIAALADYVTEKHNPANRKGVEMVVIELPLPFLRRGLEFVDTPGIGSAIKANTETAYSFLPKCDAVLFVTSVDSPLSEAELELLRSIRQFVRKIFFILNKIDLLSNQDDIVQVKEFVKSRLCGEIGVADISLISISARQALQAQARNVAAELIDSGLLHLQEKLAHFLATERQALFLSTIIDKGSQLTKTELQETELSNKANEASAAELKRCLNEVKAEMARSQAERLWILQSIRECCSQYILGSLAEELAACLSDAGEAAVRRLDRFLARVPLLPAVSLTGHYTKATRRLFWTRVSRWMARNNHRLIGNLNAAAKAGFGKLRLHLAGLAALPQKTFGLATTEIANPTEELDWLRLEPHFEHGLGGNARWMPSIPFLFRFLPTTLMRSWLRKYLHVELQKLVGEQEAATIRSIQNGVDECVRTLSQKVSAHAAKLERRASDVLSDKSRKQTDRPAGMLSNETARLYSRGLQSLGSNFSALRKYLQTDLKSVEDVVLDSVEPIFTPSSKLNLGRSTKLEGGKNYASRGCPICDHLVSISKEFFAGFQYSLYNDEQKQRTFAENGGFCPFHLWQLEAVSSPVGFSVGVAKLVKRIARVLDPGAAIESVGEMLQQIGPLAEQCPACDLPRESEHEFIEKFTSSAGLLGELGHVTRQEHRKCLASEQIAYLRRLPLTQDTVVGECRFHLAHAMPSGDFEGPLIMPDISDDDLGKLINDIEADVICCGHTHLPMIRKLGQKIFLNPGSVGLPLDGDQRASYAVWQDGEISIRRTKYDISATAIRLVKAGLPPLLCARLSEILTKGLGSVLLGSQRANSL
jgi:predicted phosphodiesterase/GTP-binding protein EngB required for normal cell division